MNIQKMMKQAQEMQRKIADMQAELEAREMEGSSGGGAIKLTLTGKGALTKLSIDASVINAEDKEMLEDLIIAAHNDAKAKIDDATSSEMGKIAGGLNLPAGMKLPF
jgi:DNA-binding YbaB/EbfC family protein